MFHFFCFFFFKNFSELKIKLDQYKNAGPLPRTIFVFFFVSPKTKQKNNNKESTEFVFDVYSLSYIMIINIFFSSFFLVKKHQSMHYKMNGAEKHHHQKAKIVDKVMQKKSMLTHVVYIVHSFSIHINNNKKSE